MSLATKSDRELVYHNRDNDGIELYVWKGPSLKRYPNYIAEQDGVFYLETTGRYRFTLKDQIALEGLVLKIVVVPERRREKAQLFIDEARRALLPY